MGGGVVADQDRLKLEREKREKREQRQREKEEQEKREKRKVRLTDEQYAEFKSILQNLDTRRASVEAAMGFVLDVAEASEDVVQIITQSLTLVETPVPKKVARLYLVSDVLHNSSASVRNASSYRTHFQERLPAIFQSLAESRARVGGRLTAATMRKKVLSVLAVWDDWSVYPPLYLVGLEMTFVGSHSDEAAIRASLGDLDEATLDVEALRKKCRQTGLVDTGAPKDLLVRLHCVNEFTRMKGTGGLADSSALLLLPGAVAGGGLGGGGPGSLLSGTVAVSKVGAAKAGAVAGAAAAVDVDGEDLDGEDLDGEDLDGEDLDGEDL